ncbi:MAG: D-alanyl-D-alanine carboxypeptidase/D-alanyl-D-alanine-endopeptidase [Rickettsiales bacterium]|nr:D-alanyl-D-alanine carboxypeptidase/D-alanyl-D-alanine-endopeptidase [Rickettsiales bacterium]|tara:strand:- start:4391 stop:5779 length:1389 start_codon:yes stop_codon:yes gene_type:complete
MRRFFCFFLVVLCADYVFAFSTRSLEETLQSDVYKHVDVAVSLKDLDKDNYIFSVRDDSDFIPASLTKLLLTGTCLEYLSTSFRFKTKVYLDKESLPTLYVKGVGDPNQTLEQFHLIAQALLKKNVRRLKSIVLDSSMIQLDANRYGNSARYYYALGGAFNFNYNQVQLLVHAEDKQLQVSPQTNFVELDVRSLQFLSPDERGFPSISLQQRPSYDKYIIRGKVSKQDEAYTNLQLRVSRPTHFYASMLKQVLLDHDIKVLEPLHFDSFLTRKKKRLLTLTSLPLSNYLEEMNQKSSNIIASIILKILGRLEYGDPGTHRKGLRLMKQFLEDKLDLESSQFTLQDGSGLSHHNRLTANHMNQFLDYFHQKYPELVKTMFVDVREEADYDSIELPDRYHVYVKSGTLSNLGVNNLAGYILDSITESVYSFVILTKNDGTKKPAYKGTLSNPLLQQLINITIAN